MLDWKFNEAWNEVNRLNEADEQTNTKEEEPITEFNVLDVINLVDTHIGDIIDLHKYVNLLRAKQKNGTIINSFFKTKPAVYLLQYIINSFKTEAAVAKALGGIQLAQNSIWSINSTAAVGDDGYALADIKIDDKDIEVKTFKSFSTVSFNAAHNKPFVLAYIMNSGSEEHWQLYFKTEVANSQHAMAGYAPVAENAEAIALLTKIRDSGVVPQLIKLSPVSRDDIWYGYNVKVMSI